MKKLLLFVLLFWSVASQAQDFPAYQSASTPNYRYRFLGAVQSDKGFINGVYTDTTSANSGYIDFHEGAQIWTTSDKKFWLRDSVNNIWLLQGINTNETRLVSGGVVSWDSLLKFSVSPAVYYVNGILYTSPQTALTLDPANATFDRIDIIYLDETGAHKLTGDAAASPAEPNLPPNSIRLTAIQVAALATTPTGIDTTIIYDENVEWTGAATSVTTNFAGTIGVCHFVKTTDLGAVTSASYIQYTRTSPIRISRFTLLKFSLSLKAAFANGTQLQISWRRAGVLKSTTINLANNTFGYLRTTSGCQTITIPLSAWSFLSDSIDQIRFQFTGSNASGCYIDWVQLQGISQSAQPAGQRFGVSGEDAVMTQNRYTNFHDQNFMNFDSVNSFVITARDTRFKNLSGQDWLSKTFANVTQMKDDNNQIRYYQDNVGSAGGTSILSADGGKVVTVTDSKVWLFANNVGDSIGSTVLPYNSGTQVVEMVQDTISGKWYRKTAGGGTPTLQQVFDTEVGGSLLTKNDTIDTGSKYLMVRRTSGAATALIVEGGGSVGINVSTTASTAAIIGAGGDGGAVGGSFSIAPAATNTFFLY